MILLQQPTAEKIERFLARQQKLEYTYRGVGCTASDPPAAYVVDRTRVELGRGEEVYEAAKTSLQGWLQFRIGWLQTWPEENPIREGQAVAIIARSLGVWWLNACRIVYVVPDDVSGGSDASGRSPVRRFAFAYGTLPDHIGSGEERFLVEMDEAGRVWYDILAFSRPQHLLARLGYPFLRRVQKQFGRASAAAMKRAVSRGELAAPCLKTPPP